MYYLDPDELLAEVLASQRAGECSEELARMFLLLATRMSERQNFRSYSYLGDLIQEGAIRCCKYYDKYRHVPGASTPFNYFSRVLWNSFLQTIIRENKHAALANQLITEQGGYEFGYSVPAHLF